MALDQKSNGLSGLVDIVSRTSFDNLCKMRIELRSSVPVLVMRQSLSGFTDIAECLNQHVMVPMI